MQTEVFSDKRLSYERLLELTREHGRNGNAYQLCSEFSGIEDLPRFFDFEGAAPKPKAEWLKGDRIFANVREHVRIVKKRLRDRGDLTDRQICELSAELLVLAMNHWPRNELLALPRFHDHLVVFGSYTECDDGGIRRAASYGCDRTCSAWAKLEGLVRTVSKSGLRETEAGLTRMAENATYGGMGGIVGFLNGAAFRDWVRTGDLIEAIKLAARRSGGPLGPDWTRSRSTGRPLLQVGVWDFNNGSGHDESFEVDWEKLPSLPSPALIILANNFADGTFGFSGIGKREMGFGTQWCNNIWMHIGTEKTPKKESAISSFP